MTKFFGTDGIRAVIGEFPLVEDFVKKLSFTALDEISKNIPSKNKLVFIGRDTRGSGAKIDSWIISGLQANGADIIDLGICPTPAVSYLTKKYNALCGIVISASHNPPEFNGIKFFDSNGKKLATEIERKIESRLDSAKDITNSVELGNIEKETSHLNDYSKFLLSTLPEDFNLKGFKLVVDCANGANYKIAPEVFRHLGAEIITLGCNPNGENINTDCGTLHTEKMQEMVISNNADCGLSFDGDADRVIFADEAGRRFDGDDIIAMSAVELKKQNKLKNNAVVLTVMSNAGLVNFLEENGIKVATVSVGDKYVTQKLDELNYSIGGETSGHIIFHDFIATGDGLLTALQTLVLLKRSGKKMSRFKNMWAKFPSLLKAVTVKEKIPLEKITGFNENVKKLEQKLGVGGRILVRYSGTEPKLRILAEGPNGKILENIVQEITDDYQRRSEELKCR